METATLEEGVWGACEGNKKQKQSQQRSTVTKSLSIVCICCASTTLSLLSIFTVARSIILPTITSGFFHMIIANVYVLRVFLISLSYEYATYEIRIICCLLLSLFLLSNL